MINVRDKIDIFDKCRHMSEEKMNFGHKMVYHSKLHNLMNNSSLLFLYDFIYEWSNSFK